MTPIIAPIKITADKTINTIFFIVILLFIIVILIR